MPVPDKKITPLFCGDFDILIDRDGVWHYNSSPIVRKEIVCLFASALERDKDGVYWLITPAEKGRIQVEDAPFIAVEIFHAGEGCDQIISFRTNVDEIVTLDDAHPLRITTDPKTSAISPYITLRQGIDAKLSRPVYYDLVELGSTKGDTYGLWSSGTFFPLES
jgi:uncharacterized protein